MGNKEKLQLGIEIVATMKASAYDCSIEDGRIMAVADTEISLLGGISEEEFESYPQVHKDMIVKSCACEKERLYKQAMFVSEIALSKISELN